jgi:hypothetical protein
MTSLILGIVLWLLLAAAAWKYSTYRPTLHYYDRVGALVCGVVIGVPVFIVGLVEILHSTIV